MQRVFKYTTAAVLIAMNMPAWANDIVKLNISSIENEDEAPVIRVLSDQGERWNRIDPAYQSLVKVGLEAECETSGRDNSRYEGELSVPGFLPSGNTRPLNPQIPDSLTASRLFTWGDGNGQGIDPVDACNSVMQEQVDSAQTPTKYHVLAGGLTLTARDALTVNYTLTCNRAAFDKTMTQTRTENITAKIVCAGSDDASRRVGPLVAQAGSLLRVDEVRIEQSPSSYFGDCPMDITVNATIAASAPGIVRYSVVADDGWESPTYEMRFERAGVARTVELNRNIQLDSDGWMQINVLSPAPAQAVRAPFSVNCR